MFNPRAQQAPRFGQNPTWGAELDARCNQYPGGATRLYSANYGTGGGAPLPDSDYSIRPDEMGGTIVDSSTYHDEQGRTYDVYNRMLNEYAKSLGTVALEKVVEAPDNVVPMPMPMPVPQRQEAPAPVFTSGWRIAAH